jgi:dihydroxy-acid dehydratase
VGHISPEAACGGPLAIVENGDIINIDINQRRIDVELPDDEIRARLGEWQPVEKDIPEGFLNLYAKQVSQAERGAVLKPQAE